MKEVIYFPRSLFFEYQFITDKFRSRFSILQVLLNGKKENSVQEKGGKKRRERKRERRGSERERDEESMRERDRWGSEWVRERGRLLKREREREREREKDEESMRIGKERKSP